MDQNFEKSGFQPRKIYQPEHGTSWRDLNPAHDKGKNRLPNFLKELIPAREDLLAARRRLLIATGAAALLFSGSLFLSVLASPTPITIAPNEIQPPVATTEQPATQNSFAKFLIPTTYSSDGRNIIKPTAAIINAEVKYTNEQADKESQTFLASKGAALLRYANVQKWSPLIDEAVNDPKIGIKEEEKEDMKKLMKLLISIESNGDPKAESNNKAYGLGQIKEEAAKQTAQYLGIKTYDIFNPRDNIRLSLAYLQIIRRSHPSMALALTEYNAGPGIMIGADRTYILSRQKENNITIDALDHDFDTLGADGRGHTATWVHEVNDNITLAVLRESAEVQAYLKKNNIDANEFGQNYFRMVSLAKAWNYIR
ncbi:lytic transglycosylase domain-containing protein [Candidatus Daviesbacteria bacterium]|nr:lytic transglycosylase domain-containing protein [Candidatus Daviesbacteria bacterium]